MIDYNWDREYDKLFWVLRYYGVDVNNEKLENLLRVVFYNGYTLGYTSCEEAYDL